MAQLSTTDFYAKWVPLLADNVFQDIDGPRLAELLADLRDSFAPAGVAVGQGATLRFDRDYEWPLLGSGPVTASLAGAVVGAVVRVRLGVGVAAPALPPAFVLLDGSHTAGKVNLYCFCVAADLSVDYFIRSL